MELVSTSRHLRAALTTALDITGREHLVVAAKATWEIPAPRQRPRPLPPQPLFVADGYYGAPGESALRHGGDFARFKARCDVLFDACAHAPDGRPVSRLEAAVRVGALDKRLRVLGARRWQRGAFGAAPSAPESFVSMPLHFGHAFGGAHTYTKRGETLTEALMDNPAGLGWGGPNTRQRVVGAPLANLEHPDNPIRRPDGDHTPWALGALARHWRPRSRYAGTYDDAWRRELAPFLPEDFDERFHQCAPEDQQIEYPQGGEPVVLTHLLPRHPVLTFALPPLDRVKLRVLRTDYSTEVLDAVPDTLFFETEAGRFSVVWRASTPIRRRIQEFDTLAIGPVAPTWWRARALGLDGGGCPGCAAETA